MEAKALEPVAALEEPQPASSKVFSNQRTLQAPQLVLPPQLVPNSRLQMDGLDFLSLLPSDSIPVAFLDPQYRGVLDKLGYGNEGVNRGKGRSALMQMSEATIAEFVRGIDRTLIPSGHLFLWMDKFHLCQGFKDWLGWYSAGCGRHDRLGQGPHGHGLSLAAAERVLRRLAEAPQARQRCLEAAQYPRCLEGEEAGRRISTPKAAAIAIGADCGSKR